MTNISDPKDNTQGTLDNIQGQNESNASNVKKSIQLLKTKEDLEREKLTIEIEKITLEKKEMEKIWPKRLQKWIYVLPSILGLGALLAALFTGYLNKASMVNKDENILIQLQTRELETKKAILYHQSDSLKHVADSLQLKVDTLKNYIEYNKHMWANYEVDLITYSSKADHYQNLAYALQDSLKNAELKKNDFQSSNDIALNVVSSPVNSP